MADRFARFPGAADLAGSEAYIDDFQTDPQAMKRTGQPLDPKTMREFEAARAYNKMINQPGTKSATPPNMAGAREPVQPQFPRLNLRARSTLQVGQDELSNAVTPEQMTEWRNVEALRAQNMGRNAYGGGQAEDAVARLRGTAGGNAPRFGVPSTDVRPPRPNFEMRGNPYGPSGGGSRDLVPYREPTPNFGYRPPGTGAMDDLRAIGGSLGEALGKAKGVGAAVMRNPLINNPLTRTLGRAVGPLGTAAGLYSAYDELTDPTSRANQHNALYNQALEEGRYGDAVGEGAMSVANTVGAATGTRGIYDFLAGLGGGGAAAAAGVTPAAAAPAAAPKTPGNTLPIFAQGNQLGPLPPHAENETPSIRIFKGGDAQHPEIYDRNDETGRYDYRVPADPKLANELQKAAIEAKGRVAAAQAGVERAAAGRHPMDQLTADLYQKKAAVDEQLQQLNPAQPDYKQRRQQLLLWQKMFADRMNELPKFYPRLNASTYVDSSAGEDTNYGK